MNFLSRLRPAGCAVVLVFLPTLRLAAADAHILPEGAGTKDGSSWENARPGTVGDFQAAWEALTPGDTLHVGSGTYAEIALAVSHEGAARNPVRLKGVDLGGGPPKFVSSFDRNNPGSTGKVFFQAAPGVSWFEIEGLKLENYQTGFRFPGRNTNIRIANIGMESFREGLRSESSPSSGALSEWCHNVIVEDCRFVNFTKRAIRLQGGNCHWTIRRCFADAGGREWFTEPFAICFQVVGDDAKRKAKQGGAHDHHITFADCVALNTYHEKSGGYWNGDGFCAERGTSHLRYERCYAAGHTDAGWDDKSEGPQLVDCIAVDNKRNYRFWGRDVTLSNCVSAFARKRGGRGGATGLWSGGEVEAVDCTFFDDDGPPFSVDGEKPDSRISLKNCLVVSVPPAGEVRKIPGLRLTDCVIVSRDDPTNDPQIPAQRSTERDAGPAAYDSARFGTSKGFHSSRMTKASR
jgi:hypothetical protein